MHPFRRYTILGPLISLSLHLLIFCLLSPAHRNFIFWSLSSPPLSLCAPFRTLPSNMDFSFLPALCMRGKLKGQQEQENSEGGGEHFVNLSLFFYFLFYKQKEWCVRPCVLGRDGATSLAIPSGHDHKAPISENVRCMATIKIAQPFSIILYEYVIPALPRYQPVYK